MYSWESSDLLQNDGDRVMIIFWSLKTLCVVSTGQGLYILYTLGPPTWIALVFTGLRVVWTPPPLSFQFSGSIVKKPFQDKKSYTKI